MNAKALALRLEFHNIIFTWSYDPIYVQLIRAVMDWTKLTSAPTDNIETVQKSTSSRSESQPDSPPYSIEELSAPPAPPESNPGMPTSVTIPSPNDGGTEPVALPELPVGASTGPVIEHERSSLETSSSIPSVENASTSALLAGTHTPQPSHLSLGTVSTCSVISDSTVSSSPSQNPIWDIKSSKGLNDSTTLATQIVSLPSSAPLFPTSLNSSTACNSASSYLSAGSGNSLDCSPSPASHCTNMNRKFTSNAIQDSGSSPELGSIKEELMSTYGPAILPTSKTFPRRPARGGQKGEGWPYAPQGWPEPADKWLWRVGKRVHANGYFRDRYLGLPKGLRKGRKPTEFASKKSIVEYLKENFPDLSVENFFKSFQWRIPNVYYWNSFSAPGLTVNTVKRQRTGEENTDAPSSPKRSKKQCKAGNAKCGLETGRSILLGDHLCLACDVCCTEPGFCRECKCILCCKTITPELGESNFVRCLCKPSGDGMCGHAAHLECALHSKMAGVVKDRGLDMEYLCRRCDNKTDLREVVTLLIEAVDNTAVRTHAEKSLELALEVMKGTERGGSGPRVLESLVQTALRKVQTGADIKSVFADLKDQGAAAEAARQRSVGRGSTVLEDVSQQPEASLDQWLPSSDSPSSNPSPGTPSSFTSPRLRSNPSVTSGQVNGTQAVDGSLRKYRAADGHTDDFGEPQTSHEGFSNSKYKNSHLGNKALMRNAGQPRGSERIRTVSSNVNNGLEAICDSFTTRTPGNHVTEPGSFDGNSSVRANHNSNFGSNLNDQRGPSSDAGKFRDDTVVTEMCKSCGAVRRHTNNAVEISSSVKSPKIEDGGNKVLTSPLTQPREEEPGDFDGHKHLAESDTGADGSDRPRSTYSANGSLHKPRSASLQLLHVQCEQDMQAALQKLRRAQEAEFDRAKACLTAKKESIVRKYELLETTRREFSEQPVLSSLHAFDELLLRTGNQFAGAIEERDNFKKMLKIGEGFGSVSKDDLKKLYRWPPEN